MLICGTNAEHGKISDVVTGNMVTSTFKQRSVGFEATINLNDKKCIKIMVPFR
jgi:hypothetical protein